MSIIKFITSKDFFKQIGLAIVGLVVFCFLILFWLKSYTNHGDFETVQS